ncbi:hypothetical protein Ahia01_001267500 [Argonauta hians]
MGKNMDKTKGESNEPIKMKDTQKEKSEVVEKGGNNCNEKSSDKVDWSKYGVQRCSGCKFTTDDKGLFDAHTSICRSFNEKKVAANEESENKKKYKKILLQLEEPYLEGKTPSITTFLLRCYHCRCYFSKVSSIKAHHSLKHAQQNLMFCLVPFDDTVKPVTLTVPVTEQSNINCSVSDSQPSCPAPLTSKTVSLSNEITPSVSKNASKNAISMKNSLDMSAAKKKNLQICPQKGFEENVRKWSVPPAT